MEGQLITQNVDDLLLSYLRASTDEESDRLLEQLINEHARPLVRQIVKSKLRVDGGFATRLRDGFDADDITSEVILQLVKQLRRFRTNPDSRVFGNFRGYVAVAAYNACHDYLRQIYPERSRLKSKIRYTLTHKKGFALWENQEGRWLAGRARWREEKRPACAPQRLEQLCDNARMQERSHSDSPALLLETVFDLAGGPVELNELVNLLANVLKITEPQAAEVGQHALESQPAGPSLRQSIVTRIEQCGYLQRLWAEICRLPLEQRHALLLNLKDEQGRDMVTLLAHVRVATIKEIAEALGMTAVEFAEVWNDLPLDDATIASRLRITRQQVINLRQAARRRLSRRMKTVEA
ncbi:MAG TPA: sigma factor [Blastocatellia bacterium]|nr:sigma factor [Blastocatellia bacterium]